VPLCPPQIPHGLTRDRTRASALGSRRLTGTWTYPPAASERGWNSAVPLSSLNFHTQLTATCIIAIFASKYVRRVISNRHYECRRG
jgi:hypothetical protein